MAGPANVEGWVSDPVEATFPEGGTLPPVANRDAVTFRTVDIVNALDAVQGPDVAIPDGRAVTVIFRSTQSDPRKGFIANSEANVNDLTLRTEVGIGDVRRFWITNMNLLWFGADTDGSVWELFVEQ